MSFSGDVLRFVEDTKRRNHLIAKEALALGMEAATTTQPSVKRTGGSYEIGKVAVDTGELIGTARVVINGRAVATGTVAGEASMPPNIRAALEQMDPGDTVELQFVAQHARAHEYGNGRSSGRFYVREALVRFPSFVNAAVAKHGNS